MGQSAILQTSTNLSDWVLLGGRAQLRRKYQLATCLFAVPGFFWRHSTIDSLARLLAVWEKRFLQRAFFGADDGAGIDVVPGEPAVPGFQNEQDVVLGGNDGTLSFFSR